MSAGSVAAVDLGAGSGRVVLGRVGRDTLEASVVSRFPNDPVPLPDGLHWDTPGLYARVLEGLREATRAEPALAGIGIDSWGVDYALLRGERLLGIPFHYRDDRTIAAVERVHALVPHAELYRRNGLQFLTFTSLYQLAAEPPELLELADRLLFTPDLFGHWLTGAARAERTMASTSGLLDAATGQWDEALCERLGLPPRLLPPLIDPGGRLGVLRPEVAEAIGAAASTEVIAVGSHDTASAVVAIPAESPDVAYVSCGTWGLVGVELRAPVLTDAAREAGFTNEGGVDGRVRFLRNVMGLWVLTEAIRTWERESGGAVDLTALLDEAAAVDPRDVTVFDINDDRFFPPGDMPARIAAWCAERDLPAPRTRAEHARAIVESLAQAFADAALAAGRLGGVDVRAIHLMGGGSRGELLCRRTADRSGLPVLAGPVEATALGNLLVQARALGLVDGALEDLRALVARTSPPRRYDPR